MRYYSRLMLMFAIMMFAIVNIPALGQTSPGLQYGQVPTVAQWNSYFAAKQDALGSVFNYNGTLNVTGLLEGAGSQTNDNAAAGYIGEYTSATVLAGAAVPLTNNTAADVTSLSLTAGDWEVTGTICFAPANTTSVTVFQGWISQASATAPTDPNTGAVNKQNMAAVVLGTVHQCFPIGSYRASLSAPATVYLTGLSAFTVSTMGEFGFLQARRMR